MHKNLLILIFLIVSRQICVRNKNNKGHITMLIKITFIICYRNKTKISNIVNLFWYLWYFLFEKYIFVIIFKLSHSLRPIVYNNPSIPFVKTMAWIGCGWGNHLSIRKFKHHNRTRSLFLYLTSCKVACKVHVKLFKMCCITPSIP